MFKTKKNNEKELTLQNLEEMFGESSIYSEDTVEWVKAVQEGREEEYMEKRRQKFAEFNVAAQETDVDRSDIDIAAEIFKEKKEEEEFRKDVIEFSSAWDTIWHSLGGGRNKPNTKKYYWFIRIPKPTFLFGWVERILNIRRQKMSRIEYAKAIGETLKTSWFKVYDDEFMEQVKNKGFRNTVLDYEKWPHHQNKSFVNEYDGLRIKRTGGYICSCCDETFKTSKDYQEHYKDKHSLIHNMELELNVWHHIENEQWGRVANYLFCD